MTNRAREVVLVHSSDLHVNEDRTGGSHDDDGTSALRAVLATARALRVDVVLLAGDTFENNQLGSAILDRAGRLLAEAGMPVVILPGNYDPALAGGDRARALRAAPKPGPTRCGRPGSSATRRLLRPAPIIWHSVIGTGRLVSATAS